MAKRKRKKKAVSLAYPDKWDMGPDTAAQRCGKVIEDAKMWDADKGKYVNPNGVKRARRVDMCESYFNRGKITERQHNAALKLREAYEETMKSPPAIREIQVDDSPAPDRIVELQIDRNSKLSALMEYVPSGSRAVVDAVVLSNHSISWLKQYRGGNPLIAGLKRLQNGLDAVADGLEYI